MFTLSASEMPVGSGTGVEVGTVGTWVSRSLMSPVSVMGLASARGVGEDVSVPSAGAGGALSHAASSPRQAAADAARTSAITEPDHRPRTLYTLFTSSNQGI